MLPVPRLRGWGGLPGWARPPARAARQEGPGGRPPFRLTGRGGVLAVFGACFAGLLIADVADWQDLGGAVFFTAATLTAYYARRGSLLPVVVSPPLLFFLACLAASVVVAGVPGAWPKAAATLAGLAWWLLAGTAITAAIAVLRGLRAEIRALWPGR